MGLAVNSYNSPSYTNDAHRILEAFNLCNLTGPAVIWM